MVLYVISGWTIAAAIYPYYRAVGVGGIALLLAGGVSYTVGLLFYRARHIPYLHIVWHALVLLGSVLHFLMVYFYCI
jgi:hemolysin III